MIASVRDHSRAPEPIASARFDRQRLRSMIIPTPLAAPADAPRPRARHSSPYTLMEHDCAPGAARAAREARGRGNVERRALPRRTRSLGGRVPVGLSVPSVVSGLVRRAASAGRQLPRQSTRRHRSHRPVARRPESTPPAASPIPVTVRSIMSGPGDLVRFPPTRCSRCSAASAASPPIMSSNSLQLSAGGSASDSSASLGSAPIAARSLRLTAKARWPMA